jgi:phosphoribosylanthranilate isomerase
MTIVKVCGISNLEDARCAVEAGADMLGFILYPRSPRYVAPEKVAQITREIRDWRSEIALVGVFVNEAPEQVLATLDAAGLDLAQLSGDEPPEYLVTLNGRAYKAIRNADQAAAYLSIVNRFGKVEADHQSSIQNLKSKIQNPISPDLLLDANHPTLYGGSGQRADESLAASVARQCRLLLAGGLTPDNVAGAIRQSLPWGVDVASGVEAGPGRKDHGKVRAFVAAVRSAEVIRKL